MVIDLHTSNKRDNYYSSNGSIKPVCHPADPEGNIDLAQLRAEDVAKGGMSRCNRTDIQGVTRVVTKRVGNIVNETIM